MERKPTLTTIAIEKLHPCKLGYVMSDEEIQLRDGTHPIFTTGEVK